MHSMSKLAGSAGLLLSCLLTSAASAQTPCSITLRAGEEGNISVKQGETVSVCLPLNSGTGYAWKVQMGGDDFTLQPKASVERSGTQPGAPGFTRFTMKPQASGDYTLIFMLVPPGNRGAEEGRAFVGLKVI